MGGRQHKIVVLHFFAITLLWVYIFFSLYGLRYCPSEALQNELKIWAEDHTH